GLEPPAAGGEGEDGGEDGENENGVKDQAKESFNNQIKKVTVAERNEITGILKQISVLVNCP
ncbi:MAG: hypothetical protein KAU21_16210, partial [Gammaproteobacteria bacterium]|nr:hypothetical protein [Gammaproteobacteria bacterium]